MGTEKNEWKKSSAKGVYFREHPTRRIGKRQSSRPDRYFKVRFKAGGVVYQSALGWESDGFSLDEAVAEVARLRRNAKEGTGPTTKREEREQHELERQLEMDRLRKDAEEAAARAEEERRLNVTFGECWELYAAHAREDKKFSSWRREQQLHKDWIGPVMDHMPMLKVTDLVLRKLRKNMLDAGLAVRTVQYALAVTRQVFNFVKRHRNGEQPLYVGENPVSGMRHKLGDNSRIRFLSRSEAGRLLDALKERGDIANHDMALLSLHCGLRFGEVAALVFTDINFNERSILIRDPKNGVSRTVYGTDPVMDMFATRIEQAENKTGLVFPSRVGGIRTCVSKIFWAVIEELGLNEGVDDPRQRVCWHSLRHTCASWMVSQGVDLYRVQRILGHSSFAMTQRYAHLAPGAIREAANTLSDYASGTDDQAQPGKVLSFAA